MDRDKTVRADSLQIKERPTPRRNGGRGQLLVATLSRCTVGLALLVSIAAMSCALYGYGDDVFESVVTFLPIILGVIGMMLGLVSFGLGLRTQGGGSLIESASIAMFLGLSAVLFSVGSTLMAREIRQLRAVAVQAKSVETMRADAARLKVEAENALLKATEEPNKILKAAKDVQKENDETSNQLKIGNAALDKRRDGLSVMQAATAKKDKDLKVEEASVKQHELALATIKQDLESQAKQLALDMKKPQELKDAAAQLRSEAEDNLRKATAARADSEKKEKEAKAYYKEVVDKLRNSLKSKAKAAINTVEQIASLPRPAAMDLREINYDLCEIAVKNKDLRQDAFNAIFPIDRGLGEAATFMIKPPDGDSFKDWVNTINGLEKFGPGGLPLIEGLLTRTTLKQVNSSYGYWYMYEASVRVLGNLAKDDERALIMLTKAPTWSYAQRLEVRAAGHNFYFGTNRENNAAGAPSQYLDPRNTAGFKIAEVCKANQKARQRAEVVDYFIDLLKDVKSPPGVNPTQSREVLAKMTEENQLLALAVLASFEGDASRAVEPLKMMRTAKSLEVRKAANEAVESIEKAK